MTETIHNELLRLSADSANLTSEEVLNNLLRPEWDSANRMYDWRNHVSEATKQFWERLSIESKLVVFLAATTAARDEEGWDSVYAG